MKGGSEGNKADGPDVAAYTRGEGRGVRLIQPSKGKLLLSYLVSVS